MFFGGDDALAFKVAAFFGPFLVFQDDAGDTQLHGIGDGADNIEGVAIAGVDIGDERNADRLNNSPDAVEHFGGGEETVVGASEGGAGNAESASEDNLESQLFDQLCANAVVDAGKH